MNQKGNTAVLLLGRQQANQHLSNLGAGVGDGLSNAASAVEGITSMEHGLAVLGLQGHLAGEDVVDGLQGICTVIASAAGYEIGDTHDHLAALDVVGAAAINVKQTGRNTLVVTGSSVGVDGTALYALGSLNSVLSHSKELPFKS